MKLYTCCPHEGCGAFQGALTWLKSHGIEPAFGFDAHHYFDFEIPDEWSLDRKIDFRWELCERTSGQVYCRCGLWLDEDRTGTVHRFVCIECGSEYLFCRECDAFDHWVGCRHVSELECRNVD